MSEDLKATVKLSLTPIARISAVRDDPSKRYAIKDICLRVWSHPDFGVAVKVDEYLEDIDGFNVAANSNPKSLRLFAETLLRELNQAGL